MEAMIQRHHGRTEMHMIGCDDADKIHALIRCQGGFLPDHVGIIAIAPVTRKIKISAALPGSFGVTAEGPTDQFNLAIEGSSHAMDGSYEGPLAATDHAHPDFSLHRVGSSVNTIFGV
jgi:hypothetical protein